MQTGKISFCSASGINIKSDHTKETLLKHLQDSYGVRIVQRHFDKYDARSASRLNKLPHLACLRSNGNPYYLYMTQLHGVNTCLFIDKKITPNYYLPRIILVRFGFEETLFQDTLLEGEMVQDQTGHWLFLVHDLLVDKGTSCQGVPLLNRLARLHAIFSHQFHPRLDDLCVFQIKRYVRVSELKWLVETFVETLPYTCRGIYFVPWKRVQNQVLYNFDNQLIKKVVRVKYDDHGFLEGSVPLTNTPVYPTLAPPMLAPPTLASASGPVPPTLASASGPVPPTLGCASGPVPPTLASASGPVPPTLASASGPVPPTLGCASGPVPPTLGCASRPVPASAATPKTTEAAAEVKTWLLEQTETEDYFRMYDPSNVSIQVGVACVPSMTVSKFLRETFRTVGLFQKRPIACRKGTRMGVEKWIPITEPSSLSR